MIENSIFMLNIKHVLRHCIDKNIYAWKIFDMWELLRIVSQCKYPSVNVLLTFHYNSRVNSDSYIFNFFFPLVTHDSVTFRSQKM